MSRCNSFGVNCAVGIPLLNHELGIPTCPRVVLVGDPCSTHIYCASFLYLSIILLEQVKFCVKIYLLILSIYLSFERLLNRIWVFSRRNILVVGSILAICLVTLGLYIVITVQILQVPFVTEFGARRGEIISAFTLGAGGRGDVAYSRQLWRTYIFFQCTADILIAGLLCYYLQHDQTGFKPCALNHPGHPRWFCLYIEL